MKRKKIKLDEEKKIITYMITSDHFLKSIRKLIHPRYFKNPYARAVSSWITEYFDEFEKTPGKDVQDLWRIKKKELNDEDLEDSVSDFLIELSRDYEKSIPPNVDFQISRAIDYLKLRSLESLKEKIEEAIVAGNSLAGEQSISNYKRVENVRGEGISILKNSGEVSSAFMGEEERLFSFPGALGQVCGPFLRGDFAAILGAMNRGKSWWLWFVAQISMFMAFRVAFFTLEMTKPQVIRRGWQSLVASPKRKMDLKIPYFEKMEKEEEEDPGWKISFREETRDPVDPSVIAEKQKSFKRQMRTGDVEIVVMPAYSATVEDIEAHLDNMEYYDNFIPDVIVIDYADIVAPSRGMGSEYRHQLDGIWKKLRGMAQQRNALVATASQTGRAGLGRDSGGEDIAEDIRKLAHVSKMIVLNQSPDDYKRGVMRISQIKERDERRSWDEAVVLQCLDIGRPCLDSRLKRDVSYEESEEKVDSRKRKR